MYEENKYSGKGQNGLSRINTATIDAVAGRGPSERLREIGWIYF